MRSFFRSMRLICLAFLLAALLLPSGAAAGSPEADFQRLLALRQANGLPLTVQLREQYSQACREHVGYMI